jgi:hypothetical protein
MSNNKDLFFKNLPEIIDSLQSLAVKNSPGADVGKNSPFHDVAIQPPAQELAVLYENLKNATLNQSIFTATEDALAQLAKNENLRRKGAVPSNGLVTVAAKALPSRNIIIPAGTKFLTNSGRQVLTVTNALLPALSDIAFQNNDPTVSPFFFINETAKSSTDSGERFGIDIPVITVEIGSQSLIDAGQISRFGDTPISGIDEILNRIPISGGLDQESVMSLRARIALAKLARQLGAAAAYKSKSLEILTVEDALVIGQGDSLMKRDVVRGQSIGGKVDIYIIGQSIAQTTQRVQFLSTATLNNITRPTIILDNQPVISIDSIVGELDGQFPSSVYSLKTDISPFIGGSTKSQDAIVFNSNFDARDQIVTVTYTYNRALYDTLTNINSTKSINADIAVFQAKKSFIDFSITVKAKKNITKGIVQQEVLNTISSFLGDFKLGQELKVGEVIALIQNLSTVDEVITKATTFSKRASTSTAQVSFPEIPINISFTEKNLDPNEYLRLGSVVVVVLENQ